MRGSVSSRPGPRGLSWFFVVDLGRDPITHKRRQKTKRGFPTKKAAEEAMRAELVKRRDGSWIEPSTEPLARYLDRWLATLADRVSGSTYLSAETIVHRRIAPHLGAVPLAKLTPLDVQSWIRTLTDAGYAPSTIHLTHAKLDEALTQAVRWRLLAHNPCDGTTLPQKRKKRPVTWRTDDIGTFLTVVAGDPHEALFRLLLDAGLRIGEALALVWDDVDLPAGTIHVRRTLTRQRDRQYRPGETTKTRAGRRPIEIAADTVTALRRHHLRQRERRLGFGPAWHDGGYVFDRGDGHFLTPARARHQYDRLVAQAGVPNIGLHGLRRTMTSEMVMAGVPLKVIADRLGHASITITADVYTHVNAEADRAAAEALADRIKAVKRVR